MTSETIDSAELRKLVEHYQPSERNIELVHETPTVLMVGISGAGKDTVKNGLLEQKPDIYHHMVSHTSRPKRYNKGRLEVNGVDYHFVSLDTARRMIENQGFIEVNTYSGNLYGTSAGEVQLAHDEGKIAITDMEVQGVSKYVEFESPNLRIIFLLPKDFDTYISRFKDRYGDDWESHLDNIIKRLHTAKDELELAKASDHFIYVVNDDLQESIDKVDHISRDGEVDPADQEHARQVMDDLIQGLDGFLSTLDS